MEYLSTAFPLICPVVERQIKLLRRKKLSFFTRSTHPFWDLSQIRDLKRGPPLSCPCLSPSFVLAIHMGSQPYNPYDPRYNQPGPSLSGPHAPRDGPGACYPPQTYPFATPTYGPAPASGGFALPRTSKLSIPGFVSGTLPRRRAS